MTKGERIRLALTFAVLVFGCAVMAVIDGIISPPYAIKSAIKVLIFGAVPVAAALLMKDKSFFNVLKPTKKGLVISLCLGAVLYAFILGAYFMFKDVFDFSAVTKSLTEGEGVTKQNFPFVALYISVCNSFLEEFFFRGFAFLNLKRVLGRRLSHTTSALAFAVYHVAIMSGWFSPLLFALVLVGLYVGGVIFNVLDEKTEDIFPSWVLHACANLATNTVGMLLFGII